ncbi:unnamed protein product [Linum trigynum]|uniref:Uncharacterized protein n=1 Tax=Linum trigynum TaxID=586398 RepID=A0AAV2E5D9_9ROSI
MIWTPWIWPSRLHATRSDFCLYNSSLRFQNRLCANSPFVALSSIEIQYNTGFEEAAAASPTTIVTPTRTQTRPLVEKLFGENLHLRFHLCASRSAHWQLSPSAIFRMDFSRPCVAQRLSFLASLFTVWATFGASITYIAQPAHLSFSPALGLPDGRRRPQTQTTASLCASEGTMCTFLQAALARVRCLPSFLSEAGKR